MNEFMAVLVIIILWLWLLYDRAKHPRKYSQAYLELARAVEQCKLAFAFAMLPALEEATKSMQEFLDAWERFCNATNQR